ncbi:MAG: non-homologous end-joining DNA ligase [Solirubrobacterales bacterium]|nr:non-homologous end-joining DNA ligase [Solirubrobacterales bacterium]
MKARLSDPDQATAWEFEVKWDGYRAIAFCGDEVRLQGRRLNDITAEYPEIEGLGDDPAARGKILDGELVVFDPDGRPDFQLMQSRRESGLGAVFLIFDLLWSDGVDLRARPYLERREMLEGLGLAGESWSVPDRLDGPLDDVLAATTQLGLEGVVAKDPESPYVSGRRTGYWRKVKNVRRQEFVVGGWLPGKGNRARTLGALLVGYREDGDELAYAGRVGTGMDDATLTALRKDLEERRLDTIPFRRSDLAEIPASARWCRPETVVEVGFTQWTRDGRLRNPVFLGLRPDKAPDEVVREPA